MFFFLFLRCRLYAAAFGGPEGSRGKFLAAGGGEGANEVKVRDKNTNKKILTRVVTPVLLYLQHFFSPDLSVVSTKRLT